MIVLRLENAPISLRGDLTKWLMEIDSGVFVGKVTARVRENLWERVIRNVKTGRAFMVYSANNEQGFEFRIHNTHWEPINFDGVNLIMRPSASRLKSKQLGYKPGTSRQANLRKMQMIKRTETQKSPAADIKSVIPSEYAVIDVETTGLNNSKDEIIEFGALKVRGSEIIGEFNALVKIDKQIPHEIAELTGITQMMLAEEGIELSSALEQFMTFVGDLPCIAHNAQFDYGFIRAACVKCGMRIFANKQYDTLVLAKKSLPSIKDKSLKGLLAYYNLETETFHRSKNDCIITKKIFELLMSSSSERGVEK
jgi:CRISPR-associated endoribonuclease Cas2, subtype I-E/ECOLI